MLRAQLVGVLWWMVTLWSPVKVVLPTVSRSIVPALCTDHDTGAPWDNKVREGAEKEPLSLIHI